MLESIIGFIILLVAHAAAGIYSSCLKYSKKATFIIWGIWIVLQCGLLIYTGFEIKNTAMQFFMGFVIPLICQYVIFFATTKGKVALRVFTMLTYSLFFCITMTLHTVIRGTFGNLHWTLVTLIQAAMMFVILKYFLSYVCPLYRLAAKNITKGWAPLLFVNVVFLMTVILSSVFPVKITNFSEPAFITFAFIGVSILSVYPVVFSCINNLSESALKKEVESQNKLLIAQIDAENAQIAFDSQARHDMRHHNLVMLEFAKNNDIKSVKEYLENLVESKNKMLGEVRFCENVTVNTVLTVYERKCREQGLLADITATVSHDVSIPPNDLVIVIANIFENAINAVSKLKDADGHIDVYIKESTRRLVVKVENPCKANLSFDETNYGIGISSVIATANKYDGMYDFAAEDGIFSAKVSLNLK